MLTTLYTVHQPVCRRGIGPHVHRGLSDRSMGFLFRLSFCTFGESGGHSVLPEARRRWWWFMIHRRSSRKNLGEREKPKDFSVGPTGGGSVQNVHLGFHA